MREENLFRVGVGMAMAFSIVWVVVIIWAVIKFIKWLVLQ